MSCRLEGRLTLCGLDEETLRISGFGQVSAWFIGVAGHCQSVGHFMSGTGRWRSISGELLELASKLIDVFE